MKLSELIEILDEFNEIGNENLEVRIVSKTNISEVQEVGIFKEFGFVFLK
jgi:hypothetical protein